MSGSELRIAMIGWGAIATRVAALLAERANPRIRVVAVAVRDAGAARDGLPHGASLIARPEELSGSGANFVIEAAGRAAVEPWARAALALDLPIAVSSTSAFCDEAMLAELVGIAEAGGGRILIPPGAMAGIDGLAAAARLPLDEVTHEIAKPAAAWRGTAAEALCPLDRITAPTAFFEGTAREAADAFPQNANVAVISALAGVGLDLTRIVLIADPGAVRNSHRIRARGAFGTLDARVENRPLATNPKSSEMTALSLLRLIEAQTAPLIF